MVKLERGAGDNGIGWNCAQVKADQGTSGIAANGFGFQDGVRAKVAVGLIALDGGIGDGGEGGVGGETRAAGEVIINNRSHPLTIADDSVADAAEIDKKSLVRFVRGIALDNDSDGLSSDAGGKGQCATAGGVIGRGGGGIIGRGIIDGDGLPAGG